MAMEDKRTIVEANQNQIAAMLGFKDAEKGKSIEIVDVSSDQSERTHAHSKVQEEVILQNRRAQVYLERTYTNILMESGINHRENPDFEVSNEATYRAKVNNKLEDHCDKLEKIIRFLQEGMIHGGIYVRDLSLVIDMVSPSKFKMLEFEKYDGITYPSMHLTMYWRRISPYLENEMLLIHCF
ncbi:hypothetical protein GQ457_05G025280 [Hibiscus cannabinus]